MQRVSQTSNFEPPLYSELSAYMYSEKNVLKWIAVEKSCVFLMPDKITFIPSLEETRADTMIK